MIQPVRFRTLSRKGKGSYRRHDIASHRPRDKAHGKLQKELRFHLSDDTDAYSQTHHEEADVLEDSHL